jgi:hypothetical protein
VVTKDISQYSLEEGEENNVNCHLAEIWTAYPPDRCSYTSVLMCIVELRNWIQETYNPHLYLRPVWGL